MGQLGRTKAARLNRHLLEEFDRYAAQHLARVWPDRLNHDQVAQSLEQVFDESSRVLTALNNAVDDLEDASRVAYREGVDNLVEQALVRVAEQ